MLAQSKSENKTSTIVYASLAVTLSGGMVVFSFLLPNPLWLWAGLLGMTVLVATARNSDTGLLLLILITYTRLSDVLVHDHALPSVAQPYVALLGGAILVRWLLSSRSPRGWERSTLLVLFYGAVSLASLVIAADYARAELALVDYAKDAIIAIFVTILLQRKETLRRAVWTLLVAGILMGTLATFQRVTGTFDNTYGGFAHAGWQNIVGEVNGFRIAGPVGDPNFFAQILVVLVPLALDRMWHEKSQILRAMAVWALVVCSLSIIFTFSRGGFIALVVIQVLALVRQPTKIGIFVLVLVGLVMVALSPPRYIERLASLSNILPSSSIPVQELSLRRRADANDIAWQIFVDHPILGVGLDNFSAYYRQYGTQLGINLSGQPEPHNFFLGLAAETGLVGLLALGILLAVMFNGLRQAGRIFASLGKKSYASMSSAFLLGMLGYLVAAFFLPGVYMRFFWLLYGIGLGVFQAASAEKEAHTSPYGRRVVEESMRD